MDRFAFVGKRLLQTIPLLFGITLFTFLIIQVTPGDPARAIGGPRASPERLEEIREDLGLNDSVVTQYRRFVGNVLSGDLGESNKSQQEVTTIIHQRWEVTAWIMVMSSVLAFLIGVPLAALAAARRDRASDHVVRGVSTVGLGMPPFWIAIMLILLVALRTHWFPVGGQFGDTPSEHFRATFLPAVALAIALSPILVRSLRSSMIGVLESDYVSAARSIGIEGRQLVTGHVLRNSLVPMMSLFAVQVGYLFFGAVLMEQTFDLPGLGDAMVFAALGRDYPVVIGITLVLALAVVLIHLVFDIVMVIIDPRVQMS